MTTLRDRYRAERPFLDDRQAYAVEVIHRGYARAIKRLRTAVRECPSGSTAVERLTMVGRPWYESGTGTSLFLLDGTNRGFALTGAVVAGVLVVLLYYVFTAHRRRSGRLREPRSQRIRVGRFDVSISGSETEENQARGIGRSAFGFTDALDSSIASTVGVIAALADGIVGRANAAVLVHEFISYVRHLGDARMPVAEMLRDALAGVDRLAGRLAANPGDVDRNGVAFAAVAVTAAGLHWVSVGEVRIYLVRDGLTRRVNRGSVGGAGNRVFLGALRPRGIDLAPAPLPLRVADSIILCSVHNADGAEIITRSALDEEALGSDCPSPVSILNAVGIAGASVIRVTVHRGRL